MQVPQGVMGQAIGVASFPILAQLYSEKKFGDLNRLLNSTFRGIVVLLVPISALTIAQSLPLVHLVFSHTRLHGEDIQATAGTMALFSVGMFAWSAQYILARGFYATRDTITPAVVGTVMTALSLPMYWWLFHRWQHLGLALASSLGIIGYAVVLFFLLNRRTKNTEKGSLVLFFAKVTAASVVVGLACHWLAVRLEAVMPWERIPFTLLLLTIVSSAGIALLFLLLKLVRVPELDRYLRQALSLIFRKPTANSPDASGLE
jgi:putative peptidoglycan lipid II flippase